MLRRSDSLPAVNSISVRSCHLFMATNQVLPLRRQLRSMTSFEVSLSRALSTDCRRSRENLPEGKRKDVMMTYSLYLADDLRMLIILEKNTVLSRKILLDPTPPLLEDSNVSTHLASTILNPLFRIPIINTTTNLQMPRPSFTSLFARIRISRPQHNHMRTFQCIFLVQICIIR